MKTSTMIKQISDVFLYSYERQKIREEKFINKFPYV